MHTNRTLFHPYYHCRYYGCHTELRWHDHQMINLPSVYQTSAFGNQCWALLQSDHWHSIRALCRIKLLPVTHVLVDTWMLTVKPVYKLLNLSDDLKWTTNTHVTPFFCSFIFVYPSTHISTRPYSFLPIQMTGGRVST